jgi:hypothetical protein
MIQPLNLFRKKIGQPTTKDSLSLPDQSQKPNTFVTLDNKKHGMTEIY